MHHPAIHRLRSRFLAFAALLVLACIFALSSPFAIPAQATTLGAGNTANNPQSNASFPPNSIGAQDAELQAATDLASGEIGTCKWVIDANGELTIAPLEGDSGTLNFYNRVSPDPNVTSSNDHRPPWFPYAEKITSATVEQTVVVTDIEGNSCRMFENCRNLVKVDLSGLDTSQVHSFTYMFLNCQSLTSVDLSALDASSITFLSTMFRDCYQLENVKLPDFSNSKIENLSYMFYCCNSLVAVDLSTIDTSLVNNAHQLFYSCSSLRKVIVGDKWDLHRRSSAIFFDDLFTNCNALIGANGTSYAQALIDDCTYARIDAPGAPGYFWPADEATGGEGTGGNEGGTGNDPSSGQGSGNSGDNGQSGAGSSSADTHGSESASSGHAADSSASSTSGPMVTLSASTFAYNGKKRTPAVTVRFGGKALKTGRDYSVTYSKGRKAIGSYNVTVTGKKPRSFKVTKSFQIIPKTPKVKSLKAQKNSNGTSGFIAKWKKVRGKSIGYQIRWSPAKTFATSATYQFKSKSPYAKKGKAALQVKNRAWLGKKAFVQVRAFKSVKGTKYYSGWSKAKRVKLKK